MADRRGLKIALATAALGLVGVGALFAVGRRSGPQAAADFVATDLAGNAVRLSALRGKVVVLNLWATWCPPCREEMPSMERLYRRFKDRDFVLLAVSEDEDGRKAVEPFVRDGGFTFPVLLDPERQVGAKYGVWGYPETFIIDRAGMVAERVIGPRDWASQASTDQIERLLSAGPPTETATAR